MVGFSVNWRHVCGIHGEREPAEAHATRDKRGQSFERAVLARLREMYVWAAAAVRLEAACQGYHVVIVHDETMIETDGHGEQRRGQRAMRRPGTHLVLPKTHGE